VQVLVVGAGVVGLAIARQAALRGHDVIVAEAANAIGTGVSSRNSEVVHAGLYYTTGSLRAYHCPRGRRMLYEFCASHGVPHRKCGKLVVATSEPEIEKLQAIQKQSEINGVEGVVMIEAAAARAMEPALSCVAALHSPETGVIDSHAYMNAMRGDLEDHGGMIALNTRIERITQVQGGWLLQAGGDTIQVDAVVNASGLGAQALGRATEGYPTERVPRLFFGKGSYFGYAGRPVFSRLIYPAPIHGGLGVHVTLDLAGRMRFGPDVEWTDQENYDVDPKRADVFYASIRKYFPKLPDGALVPDYAGIRPKLTSEKEPAADFLIDTPAHHGVPRLVNLFGIESPGLTSALSIARDVVASLGD
jgi:L-2-hydroxyglutarate oxidase LhgO